MSSDPKNCPRFQALEHVLPRENSFWVFGYGSLMWRPGFSYETSTIACLADYHRSLCIWSVDHRGTPDQPGLVFGLDKGGSCTGYIFRVAPEHRAEVCHYLWERELQSDVYYPEMVTVQTAGGDRTALIFATNQHHTNYAGDLTNDDRLQVVRRSRGKSGYNAEYVTETAHVLRSLNVTDDQLEWLDNHLRHPSSTAE